MYRRVFVVVAFVALVGLLLFTSGGRTSGSRSKPSETPTVVETPSVVTRTSEDESKKPVLRTLPVRSRTQAVNREAPTVKYSVLSTSDPEQAPPPPAHEVTSEEPGPAAGPPNARWARFDKDRDDYLRHILAPRVRDCWKKIEGQGRIEFLYLMKHDSGHGVGKISPTSDIGIETPVSIVESELAPEQSKQALNCMLDAVEGTSFTSELPTPGEKLVGMYQDWYVGKGPGGK